MNTVHCEIKFLEKKNYLKKKIFKNQINFDKIFEK